MTRIKICGITNIDDALLAAKLGADALGFTLFPHSKRRVSASVVSHLSAALPPFVEPVLLFVNEPLVKALDLAQTLSYGRMLHTIQWHGDEHELPPPAPWRFIPAFPIADGGGLDKVIGYLGRCRAANRLPAAVARHAPCLGDETVHLPAGDVVPRRDRVVRGSLVQVGKVVERPHAPASLRIGQADGRHTVPHRNPVGSRISPEVAVKGPVLLHDHHDMLDLVNVWVDRRR